VIWSHAPRTMIGVSPSLSSPSQRKRRPELRQSRFESTMFVDGGDFGDAVIASELVVFEVDPVFKNVEQQS
jgi:hypothetical protein